jgi:hypothetical protein
VDDPSNVPEAAVRQRAIAYIQKHWGRLGDLPKPLVPVVWVTVYQSLKIAMKAEAEGGPKALLKDALVGDRQLTPRFEEATSRIELLRKMIPIIRSNHSRMADAQLLIDILKWGITDAASMSMLKRTILREFAKADPEYKKPIPPEIS